MRNAKFILLTGTVVLTAATPLMVSAQTASSDQIDTVVVTARKRSEDILKIPGSVSALTDKAIALRGIETVNDLANYTPGVADDQSAGGSARSDRSFQSIIIRGMNPSLTTNPTTSIFINGTPVPSSDMIQSLSDVDRVEILKGPQSAYFGRETFAGAVNVISKSPTNILTGDLNVEGGTRRTVVVSGDVSGPVIPDKLMISVGGKYDAHDGSYNNAFNPGQSLGDQSSGSYHIAITAKPIENLTVKFYGLWLENRDGPAATGLYLSNAGKFSQGNCTVAGTPFFCGTLPGLNYSVSPAQNTAITPAIAAFLTNPGGIISPSQTVKDFGLKRDAYHTDLSAEYVVPQLGLTATNLVAYNQDKFSELSDLSNIDSAATGQYPGYVGIPGHGGFPYMVQGTHANFSEEFRISTDVSKPYRALIGYSYIDNHDNQAIGAAYSLSPGPSESITTGVFFSLAYDILPQLTINFDGRYQIDHETAYSPIGVDIASGRSSNFLPRASIQYKFTPNVMTYFTYSQGANPPAFNTPYGNLPAVSKAEIAAAGYTAAVATQPELITNYELGFKGRFLDGRATLAADIYYDKWTHQLNSETYVFQQTDPANPINVPGSSSYNPGLPSADPISFTANTAASDPKGVEVDGNLIPIEHVTLNVSAAYNDTQYTSYICTSCQPYTTFNAKGKYLPNAPLFSAEFGAMYSNTTTAFGAPMDWFGRIDYIHRDGVWLDSSNTVKTPSTELINIRGGVTVAKGVTVEAFVDNLTNEKSPVSGFQGYNFATFFTTTAVDVGLPQLITGGLKIRYVY